MKKQNKNFHPQAFLEPFLLNIQDFFFVFSGGALEGGLPFWYRSADRIIHQSVTHHQIRKSS